MKTLLICALFLVSGIANVAHAGAELVGYSVNTKGGHIELFAAPIPNSFADAPGCTGAMLARSWGNGVDDIYGCWVPSADNNTITVTYPGIGTRTYLTSTFVKPQK